MTPSTYTRMAAASLLVLGFGVLSIVAYADSRSDFEPSNVSADLAVLFAVLPVVLLFVLFRGHDAGAGVASILVGGVLLDLLFRTPEPKYFVPPLLVFFGGLLALAAHALKVRVSPPVPGHPSPSR